MSRRMMTDVKTVTAALKSVRERIQKSYELLPQERQKKLPNLVAVSKLKPLELIIEAYNNGQRHFGENYIQELADKAEDDRVLHCEGIKWHFIGHVQSKKVPKLVATPNLHMVETVHSVKLADLLNAGWKKQNRDHKLNVMIQVNTSGEENKNGVEPSAALPLATHIHEVCSELNFKGLMTIGALGRSMALPSDAQNQDFQNLIDCKEIICNTLKLNPDDIDLSMGMSSDFEHAIEMGSNSVRIGSTIFGERPKKVPNPEANAKSEIPTADTQQSSEPSNLSHCTENLSLS